MSTPRSIIVTGATGKQGGALVSALASQPSHPFEIYAVTRNKDSRGAQALARKPNVHVIEGDLAHPEAIVKQVPNPWGLFSVSMLDEGHEKEEALGKAMTTAALAAGVNYIVFTATERGGPMKSETDPTVVPHFSSKYNIEKDIVAKAPAHGATWTFLRPVAFMDNLTNDMNGKGFVSMWRLNGYDSKLQLISTSDIGRIAAEAFMNADSDEFRNKAISLAGDELTPNQAAKVFKRVTGKEIPSTYWFVGVLIKWLLWEKLGIMFTWFKTDGFGADIPELKRRFPFMQDFETWLELESAWKKNV